ncbi:MAG TPA: hypothetical protein VFM18_18370 [Methanosarcina sp.]|nr:hypothetical protein [Methanosarcina sp.]
MASNINPANIDTTYPLAGQDNDTQGFRTNFTTIYNNLLTAASEITALQSTVTNAPVITSVPLSPTSAGTPGRIAYDSLGQYFYVCYGTNQWTKFPSTTALAGAYTDATGTANALIANYNPAVSTLYDGLVIYLGANAVNSSSNVTLQVNSFSPLPVYKGTNQALLPGDIGGLNHEMLMMYNAGTNSFTLLNPEYGSSNAAISTGSFVGTYLDGVVVDYVTGNGRISIGAGDVLTVYNNGIGNIQLVQFANTGATVTGNVTTANIVTTGNGIVSKGTFFGPYTDGIVDDYVNGMGRISVGASDSVTIYNGGVGNTQIGQFSSNGFALTGNLLFSGNVPTIVSGFGTTPTITGNSSISFRLNVGTGGVATAGVVGFPLAATGWNAQVSVFNPTLTNIQQTTVCNASSNTSVTLTNVWTANAVAVAWPASTILMVQATAY